MNLWIAAVLIFSAILTSEVIFVGGQTAEDINVEVPEPHAEILTRSPDSVQVATPAPTEPPYPRPAYTPVLTPYDINKDHDIWHAQEPTSYITPDNEWVKYYASLLYIDNDGRIRYKEKPVPLEIDTKGNVLYWTDEPFVNNYVPDSEQFPSSPDTDMWVMPEYYLTHGIQDDCDGWMTAVTSLMLSGEMSVLENETFVKKVVPAKAVLGYMGGYRDGWTEYQVNEKIFLTTTALINTGIDNNEKISSTEFIEKRYKTNSRPVFEFTDTYFRMYNDWE